MTKNTGILSDQIKDALQEAIGVTLGCSVEEAAMLSGINAPTLYQLRRGELSDHDTLCRHLVALLAVPAFTERYMALRSYSCAYVGNEDACEWGVTAAIGDACGQTADFIRDGRYDHREKANLATKVLPPLVRKAIAYIAQHARRRTEAKA